MGKGNPKVSKQFKFFPIIFSFYFTSSKHIGFWVNDYYIKE